MEKNFQLQEKNQRYKDEFRKVQKDREALKIEIEQKRNENATLTKQVDTYLMEISTLRQKLTSTLQTIDRNELNDRKDKNLILKLQKELATVQTDHSIAIGRVTRLREELETMKILLCEKDDKIKLLSEEVAEQLTLVDALHIEIIELKQHQSIASNVGELKEENDRLQTEPGKTSEPASSCDVASTAGFQGTDSDGFHYSSVEEMKSAQGWTADSSLSWYDRAASYYEENCPTTIDGVLGGFASITELDIQGSLHFIHELELIRPEITRWTKETHQNPTMRSNGQKRRACECGAGIGRVSNGLLLKLGGIELCDLIESSATLLDAAPDYLGYTVAAKCRFFCTGLQDWQPAPNTYSIVWIQWVLSYLTDDDIIRFFQRCGESLVDDGLIILKENICGANENCDAGEIDFEVDNNDASVTRSLRYWKYLIHQSGLRIIYEKMQAGFPEEIYPVSMLALDVDPTHHR